MVNGFTHELLHELQEAKITQHQCSTWYYTSFHLARRNIDAIQSQVQLGPFDTFNQGISRQQQDLSPYFSSNM